MVWHTSSCTLCTTDPDPFAAKTNYIVPLHYVKSVSLAAIDCNCTATVRQV